MRSTYNVKAAFEVDNYLKNNMGLDQVQSDYAKWLGQYLIGAGAAGAAIRGTTGLAEILGMRFKPKPSTPEPVMINVPFRRDAQAQQKRANDQRTLWEWFTKGPPGATSAADIPITYPITVLGGLGALGTGYYGTNKLVENRKRQMMDDELEDARDEYEQSLLQQFKPIPKSKVKPVSLKEPTTSKVASEFTPEVVKALIDKTAAPKSKLAGIADKLDKLVDVMLEKKAEGDADRGVATGLVGNMASGAYKNILKPLYDSLVVPTAKAIDYPVNWKADTPQGWTATRAGGLYSLLAPTLAGASGLAMYNYSKDQDPDAEVADALRKQYHERWTKKPPDVFARLVPVNEQGKPIKDKRNTPEAEPKIASSVVDEVNQKATEFVKRMFGG